MWALIYNPDFQWTYRLWSAGFFSRMQWIANRLTLRLTMHSRIQIGSLNNRQFGTNKQTNKIGDGHLCPPPHPLRALPEFQLPSFFQRFRSTVVKWQLSTIDPVWLWSMQRTQVDWEGMLFVQTAVLYIYKDILASWKEHVSKK